MKTLPAASSSGSERDVGAERHVVGWTDRARMRAARRRRSASGAERRTRRTSFVDVPERNVRRLAGREPRRLGGRPPVTAVARHVEPDRRGGRAGGEREAETAQQADAIEVDAQAGGRGAAAPAGRGAAVDAMPRGRPSADADPASARFTARRERSCAGAEAGAGHGRCRTHHGEDVKCARSRLIVIARPPIPLEHSRMCLRSYSFRFRTRSQTVGAGGLAVRPARGRCAEASQSASASIGAAK